MKRCGLLAFTFLFLAAIPWAQAPPAPLLSGFAGTWKAEFHKQTWLVLNLIEAKATLTGTLTHSTQMSADDRGEITSVGDEMSSDQVASANLQDATLHITTRDEDGNADQYTLVLTGKDAADLQPVSGDRAASPKPFHLKRSPSPQK
jgi:hypothetical protein